MALDLQMPNYTAFVTQAKGAGSKVYYQEKILTPDGALATPFTCAASLSVGDTLRWFATPDSPNKPATFAADFPQATIVTAGLI